jgi:hypothetical protein
MHLWVGMVRLGNLVLKSNDMSNGLSSGGLGDPRLQHNKNPCTVQEIARMNIANV